MAESTVYCRISKHSDFSIEWDKNSGGSISAANNAPSMVIMKYESVPYFLYALAEGLDDFSFISDSKRREILGTTEMSFVSRGHGHEWYAREARHHAKYFGAIWHGTYLDDQGNEKKIPEKRLESLRNSSDISLIIGRLTDFGIDYKSLEYAGCAPESLGYYPHPVHVLRSHTKETYILQFWYDVNILRVKTTELIDIINFLVDGYPVFTVSGVLRSLLEKERPLKEPM